MSRCSLLKLTRGLPRWILPGILLFAAAPPRPAPSQTLAALDAEESRRLAPSAPKPSRREPVTDAGAAFDPSEAQRIRVLRGNLRPEAARAEEELRLRALEGFLDYDEEHQILYGPGRTRVEYGKFALEADRLILDNRLQEVQAEGNVELSVIDAAEQSTLIHADSMRYNFAESEGVAVNARGAHPPIYFATAKTKKKDPTIPDFQQISPHESLFRDATVTSCEFKVPHYRVRAREVILFMGDRVFFRGARLYIGEIPVFYFPFYSAGMKEGSPWFFQFGTGDRTGFRMRVGYEYEHMTKEPTLEDDDVYETRSRGQAQLFTDVLTKRGIGVGGNYEYEFDFGRHKGRFETYGIDDSEREVSDNDIQDEDGEEEDEADRWQIYWKHRSQLTDNLSAVANVDWFSDPEFFYDILDAFQDTEFERERQIERRARGALTYVREAWVARLLVERKDRIGINRHGDFSDPGDNNLDFEFDPGVELDDSDSNSIAHSRWGKVTERWPQFTAQTRYLPIRNWPLFWLAELTAYNNLDKGINIVSEDDDARVAGGEFYNQLLWQYHLTQRYVLIAKIGAGAGVADRQEEDLGLTLSEIEPGDTIKLIDDDGTFLVGDEDYNLDDIDPFYAWFDAQVRLNARFSDALSGYLLWKFRETTEDFIGEFYAKIGDVTSREDLYNYRLREHWVEASLSYTLLYPALVAYVTGAANMTSEDDLFPNEQVYYWSTGLQWANRAQTTTASGSIGQSELQLFAPSDDRSDRSSGTFLRGDLSYTPIHGRWYAKLKADKQFIDNNDDTQDFEDDDLTLFSDEDDRMRWTLVYGRELGPKWDTELRLRWDSRIDGLKEISWMLQRDLHDALAIFRIRSRADIRESDSKDDVKQETDMSFGLKLKLPESKAKFGQGEIKTVRERARQPVVSY